MSNFRRQMGLNDRLCIALRGKREPYNIVRVIDINDEASFVCLYFSLLKREIRLAPLPEGIGYQIALDGHPITITFLAPTFGKPGSASIEFSAGEAVEFRPLKKRESYYAANPRYLRDGADVQRQNDVPPSGQERGS